MSMHLDQINRGGNNCSVMSNNLMIDRWECRYHILDTDL